ncbi:MAG: TonB-dependent receptor [Hyphococcus sp.]|nr:MAG: TonB-dependent receptor [Marinicaulis sp.]
MGLREKSNWLIGVSGLAFFAGQSPALAQDAAPVVGSETTESGKDVIVVTARKREESLQEFAGAITAITEDQFATNQIVNMQDIRDLVPNLYIEEDLGGQSTVKIFVRGIGIDNPDVSFDSPVGIYVDGVYHARAFGSLSDLHDVEQVEFLRGPQGTLYGRNNSAGALRVISKKPVLDEVQAGGSFGYGTENQINANAYLNLPLQEDKLGLRLSFATRNNDGFMTEVNSGGRFKKDDMITARASLLFAPGDQWKIIARADALFDNGTGSLASSIVPAFNADDDIFTADLNLAPENSLDVWGTSLEISRDGSALDFTSITAYRGVTLRNSNGDADGTPLSLLEGVRQNLDEHQVTQEAFVTSSFEPAGLGIEWTAGVFYFHEVNDADQSFNVFPAIFGPATTQLIRQETDAFAVYGEADIALSERITLTGGIRYTDETKNVMVDSFNNDGSFGFDFSDEISLDRVTWKAGLDYAVTDNFFLYATAGTGFRSGGIGINPAARDVAGIVSDTFGPETAMSYEGGFKSSFMDGAVTFNATYFYVEYESLQLAVAGAGGITVNTPDATVHGLEAEMKAELFEGLTLNANVGTQFDDIKLSTLELKNTPDWQGRLGLTYVTALPNGAGQITIAGDVSYTDDYFVSTANSIAVEGHPLVNAMARWDSESGRWGVSISGRNLTDEFYPIHGFKIIPGLLDNLFPNHPRRWFAAVHFSY